MEKEKNYIERNHKRWKEEKKRRTINIEKSNNETVQEIKSSF